MIFIDKYGAKYRTIKKANGLEIWNRNRGGIVWYILMNQV